MKLIKHLKERGMNPALYRFSRSYSANSITFFLYNFSGKLVGYQQYRPLKNKEKNNHPKQCRYFTYAPKDTDVMFGLDLLNPNDRNIFIVEGIFKAAVLHRLGYNAIAVLTSSPKRLKPWFKIMRQTWNLIAIGDNDAAGQLLVNAVKKGSKSPVDLDEMTDEEIHFFIKKLLTS